MRFATLTSSEAGTALAAALGQDPTSPEGLADLIRHEVSARGASARHVVLGRVARLAAPGAALSPELLDAICEDLEREGDVLVAPGGVLHASPVRIVTLAPDQQRFVCAMPSSQLIRRVPGAWSVRGVRRVCVPERPVASVADALGAAVMTPSVWAGLDRAPCADAVWLRALDARLAWDPKPARSVDRDEVLEWTGYDLSQTAPRWTPRGSARLWRARHRLRRWVFAWTAGTSPSEVPSAALGRDEGTRTTYALAREAGHRLSAAIHRDAPSIRLELPGWLPLAEYRYLATMAEPLASGGRQWAIAPDRCDAILETLGSRLGLRFDEEPG